MQIKIITIRHGQSEANIDPSLYFKKPDHKIELTTLGKEQITTSAINLKNQLPSGKTRIVYSPWVRARQSATILKDILKVDSQYFYEDALIHEISLSHSLDEMKNQKPFFFNDKEAYSQYWFKDGTGESYNDVYLRARIFYQDLLLNRYNMKEGETLLVVAHSLFLQIFNIVVNKGNIDTLFSYSEIPNGEGYTYLLNVLDYN